MISTEITVRMSPGSWVTRNQVPTGIPRLPAIDNGATRCHSTSRSASGTSWTLVIRWMAITAGTASCGPNTAAVIGTITSAEPNPEYPRITPAIKAASPTAAPSQRVTSFQMWSQYSTSGPRRTRLKGR